MVKHFPKRLVHPLHQRRKSFHAVRLVQVPVVLHITTVPLPRRMNRIMRQLQVKRFLLAHRPSHTRVGLKGQRIGQKGLRSVVSLQPGHRVRLRALDFPIAVFAVITPRLANRAATHSVVKTNRPQILTSLAPGRNMPLAYMNCPISSFPQQPRQRHIPRLQPRPIPICRPVRPAVVAIWVYPVRHPVPRRVLPRQ